MKAGNMKDSLGRSIKVGDVLAVYHRGESIPVREFRYLVEFNKDVAAFVLTNPNTNPHFIRYLGSVKKDVNYIQCEVVGRRKKLLDIPNGHAPGTTFEDVDKMRAKYSKLDTHNE